MDFKAFTNKYPTRVNVLNTICWVSFPVDIKKYKPSEVIKTKVVAIWDTGATGTVIKPSIAKKLGVKPIKKVRVNHAGGFSLRNVYLIHLFLPNDVALSFIPVTECDENSGDFDVLIGMDVISQGDFSITHVDGKTVFSYRLPSVKKIDYVEEAEAELKVNEIAGKKKIGRNDPCPCGSGKKYKHCHGKGN